MKNTNEKSEGTDYSLPPLLLPRKACKDEYDEWRIRRNE